jgi:hypothetical protein
MSEPIFIKRAAVKDIEASPLSARAWVQKAAAEARLAGAKWLRVSWTPDGETPVKVVVEGWAERPKDEGGPRFE